MIVSDVGRTMSGSSSAELGSGSPPPAPPFPLARRRVCVTIATSFANPPTCSASRARKLCGGNSGEEGFAFLFPLAGAGDRRRGGAARGRGRGLFLERGRAGRVPPPPPPRAGLAGELPPGRDAPPADRH